MSISLYPNIPKPVVPNSAVTSSPVNPTTSSGDIAPTAEVADTPVSGTPISGIIAPTEEVKIAGVVTPSKPILTN